MQELPTTGAASTTGNPATPNDSGEVLVSREVTFRSSTFGALKTFMREYQRRTGQTLTNAAALDMILRAHLARHIHPDAVATMARLSRPQAASALQVQPRETVEVSPRVRTIGTLVRRGPRANSTQPAPDTAQS